MVSDRKRFWLRLFASVALVVGIVPSISSDKVTAQQEQALTDSQNMDPAKGYFSVLPFEAVNMATGNLTLTFNDIVLPGNAGMDVVIQRIYNESTYGWKVGLAGFPLRILDPDGYFNPTTGETRNPVAETYDGSKHTLYGESGLYSSAVWVSAEFWRYEQSTRTLRLANGWRAQFKLPDFTSSVSRLEYVEDPFGNRIEVDWSSPTTISTIRQIPSGNPSEMRSISFSYGSCTTITWTDRSWNYCGSGTAQDPFTAQLPENVVWSSYLEVNPPEKWLHLTTPNGGKVHYRIVRQQFPGDSTHSALWHRVVSLRTVDGRAVDAANWTFSYSGDASLNTVTTPTGRTFEYLQPAADAEQRPLQRFRILFQGGEVSKTTFTHVTRRVTDYSGAVSLPSQVVRTQDGRSLTTTYSYHSDDAANHYGDYHRPYQISEQGELSRTTSFAFDYSFSGGLGALQRTASQQVTVGAETVSTSAGFNDLTGAVESQTTFGTTVLIEHDGGGNIWKVTDPLNHQTLMSYQWGVQASLQAPDSSITRSVNPDGTIASETINGTLTEFEYDALRRLKKIRPAGSSQSQTSYAADLVSTASGYSWTNRELDGFGRVTRIENSETIKTRLSYDAEGRLSFQSYPYATGNGIGDGFSYDASGRLARITHPNGKYVDYSYAGLNLVTTDENGHATTQEWKAFGSFNSARLTSLVDANGQAWTYSYSALGHLTQVQSPQGPIRTWTYNSKDQLEHETHPESGTVTYGYDADGRLSTIDDGLGQTVYSYGPDHRLAGIDAPGTTDDVTIEYWPSGARKRTTTSGGGETVFNYDVANRLAEREDHIGGHVFHTYFDYDGHDNLHRITYPSGRTVYYNHDTAERVTSVCGDETCQAQIYAQGVTYHPSGIRSGLTYGNGTTETLSLDPDTGRPLQLVTGAMNDRVNLTYGYDWVGNVTSITDSRPWASATYEYDNLDRLVWSHPAGAGSANLTYDTLGNRTGSPGVSYTYDYQNTNRLSGVASQYGYPHSSTSIQYSPVGNLWIHNDSPSGMNTTFTYSPRGTLASANVNGTVTSYAYDADGVRVQKSGSSGQRLYLSGLDSELLAEYTVAAGVPTLAREFIYLGSKLVASFDGSAAGNQLPAVQLTTPANQAAFWAPATIDFAATASDPDGTVARVDFVMDNVVIGSDSSSPFSLTATNVSAGSHLVSARAIDNTGGSGSSQPAIVYVNPPPNPTNWARSSNGATITASSTYPQWDFNPNGAINGDRKGEGFGGGGVWNDATYGEWPDWIEVNFGSFRTIHEIDVFSMQDDMWNPVEPTPSMTFSNYGLTDFEVQYWNGNTWLPVPGASVTNNTLVWKQFTFSTISASRIRVWIRSGVDLWTRITEVEAWGYGALPPPQDTNFALAVNGGWATASSTYPQWDFNPNATVNGDRTGAGFGGGAVWNDANFGVFPDWLEVNFNGPKIIHQVDIFSMQDDYLNPIEPTSSMTFTSYGLREFQVEYWTGTTWAAIPGASVTTNNLIWKQFSFNPIPTSKIRILVTNQTNSNDGWTRIVEVEAWGSTAPLPLPEATTTTAFPAPYASDFPDSPLSGAGVVLEVPDSANKAGAIGDAVVMSPPLPASIFFYHTDILGSVRAITDAGGGPVARYDYGPFGGNGDPLTGNLRRFTGFERDPETAFDYAVSRYYRSGWGRFMAADDSDFMDPVDPQSFNRYAYVLNNPLRWIDPRGHQAQCPTNECVEVRGTSPHAPSMFEMRLLDLAEELEKLTKAFQTAVEGMKRFLTAPRDPGCMATATSWGVAAGGVIGGVGGAAAGGAGGAVGGTLVLPGGGTLGGAAFGGGAGWMAGSAQGAAIGGAAGAAIGSVACMSSSGGGGDGAGSEKTKVPKKGVSGKEAASDVPSWVKGQRPLVGENGRQFATRVLDAKYGAGNYPKGPGSEFSKIQKWADRAFQNPGGR